MSVENKERPALFAMSHIIGPEDKTTNNKTIHLDIKQTNKQTNKETI